MDARSLPQAVSSELPDGLPRLAAGNHVAPADGACVMEYVSLLAGEPWSDHPRCVDPALAMLARLVNDSVPNGPRDRLALLAPDMIGTAQAGPLFTARLAALALERAAERVPETRRRRRALQRARRHIAVWSAPHGRLATRRLRLAALLYRNCAARQALGAAVAALRHGDEPVESLLDLLTAAVAQARADAAGRTAPIPLPVPTA